MDLTVRLHRILYVCLEGEGSPAFLCRGSVSMKGLGEGVLLQRDRSKNFFFF